METPPTPSNEDCEKAKARKLSRDELRSMINDYGGTFKISDNKEALVTEMLLVRELHENKQKHKARKERERLVEEEARYDEIRRQEEAGNEKSSVGGNFF
jgi:hypothetical protein